MELVEREQQLQSLADAWAQVNAGAGRIVLVSGEAGIGKTALIERFVAEEGDAAHILRGGCDDLFTPQPLGPFIEIAVQSGQPRLQQLLASTGGRLAFSAALFHQLQQEPAPVMVILEDLHWADEATLDVLKYLGRRIQHLRALLLVSYRNDEVSRNHPLRSLLGDLPASLTVRLALPQLSPAAVAQLARQAERRPEELYRVTGGNPFFVTEVLAGPAEGIPPSAREAIRLAQEPTISLIPALVTLGRLLARRGDPAAGSVLDDAYGLALPTRESQRQGPVAAARAEAAWLRGEPERIAAEADFGYALALSRNDPWVAGEVAYWAWRGGRRDIPLERLARPFADVIRGEWRAAAEQWAQLGCPFEQALALLDGDEAAQLRALALFTALGAAPAVAQARRRLPVTGGLSPALAPRRPNPDDLTPRELEVLHLLAAGLSNPAIAARLTISVGTVKAHTANIYGKLGVANRVQALARAQELRLL